MPSSDTNSLKLQSSASSHAEPPSARWYALFVTMIAGALASIQSTALIVGLTDLGKNLHAEFLTIMWMMLSFMLAVAAICPLLGFLADSGVKGSRCFMFNFGFAIFGLGSLLAGFSQSSAKGIDLVIWRSLMGVGAAFIFNNSAPILADKFHPYNQVGLAQGLWGMSFAIGSIIGPVVGGGLLDAAGWSWIFFFNVPFCAVGCIVGFWKVKDVQIVDDPNKSAEVISWSTIIRKFDFLGAILIAGGLCCLFLAITSSIFPGGNLQGDKVVIPFAVFGALGLITFALWQYKRQGNFPIIDFTMFHSKDFTLLVVGSVALSIGRGCLTFAFIFFFQGALGQDPLAAGISVIPQGVGAFLAGFVAGKLADSMGYRNLCVVGSFVSAMGVLGSCFIDQNTNYWGIAACLFVAGVGMGMYNSPSSALGVLCVKPSRRGSSSAIRFMISLVSQMFAIVICFKLIVGSLPLQQVMILFLFGGKFLPPDALKKFVDGFHGVMWIVFVCLILLGLTSLPLTKQALKMAQSPASSGPESGHQKVVEMTAKEMEEDAGKKQEEVDAPPRPTEASSEPNAQPAVVQDQQ